MTAIPETPEALIEAYRQLFLEKRGKKPNRPSKYTTKDIEDAKRVLRWCRERRVDPFTLMSIRVDHGWREHGRMPRFGMHLCVEWLVRAAQRVEGQEAIPVEDSLFAQTVKDLATNVPSRDDLRRRLLMRGQQAACIDNKLTGGYDPRSRYCVACQHAQVCSDNMTRQYGFNVAALRAGQVHLLPKEVIKALRGWNGNVPV